LVNVPDVPWIVTVTVPVAAVPVAVKLSKLLVVAGLGLKSAVTPLGKFKAERVTLPLKPFVGVIVMVLVPLLPCVTVTLLGEAERLKFAEGFTVRLSVVVLVNVPDVPWIVTVTVPVAAVPVADKVSRLLVVAGFGAKIAVTPLGKFKAERVTLPVKPFDGVMVMVLVPLLPPCVIVTLVGEAESEKFGAVAGTLYPTALSMLISPPPSLRMVRPLSSPGQPSAS
jgi:hypothetical protein